jgi:hypothetical protein
MASNLTAKISRISASPLAPSLPSPQCTTRNPMELWSAPMVKFSQPSRKCSSTTRKASGPTCYLKRSGRLSVFRPRGVPGPTSKLSPRVPAQMGRCDTEHKGGETAKGKPTTSVLSCAQVGCACSRGLQASARERERENVRQLVLSCGQPSRTISLDLPFIDVRRGPRCTMGGIAMR